MCGRHGAACPQQLRATWHGVWDEPMFLLSRTRCYPCSLVLSCADEESTRQAWVRQREVCEGARLRNALRTFLSCLPHILCAIFPCCSFRSSFPTRPKSRRPTRPSAPRPPCSMTWMPSLVRPAATARRLTPSRLPWLLTGGGDCSGVPFCGVCCSSIESWDIASASISRPGPQASEWRALVRLCGEEQQLAHPRRRRRLRTKPKLWHRLTGHRLTGGYMLVSVIP